MARLDKAVNFQPTFDLLTEAISGRTIVTKRLAPSTNPTYRMVRIALPCAVMTGLFSDRQTAGLETQTAAKPWAVKHEINPTPGMEDV